jgi:hypothetical protein
MLVDVVVVPKCYRAADLALILKARRPGESEQREEAEYSGWPASDLQPCDTTFEKPVTTLLCLVDPLLLQPLKTWRDRQDFRSKSLRVAARTPSPRSA